MKQDLMPESGKDASRKKSFAACYYSCGFFPKVNNFSFGNLIAILKFVDKI